MRLIHPIYLDVPMLVSFAAALQGGIAFGSEVTENLSAGSTQENYISGKLGISELFSQLFTASVAAESKTNDSENKKQIKTESKSHTESSIAIILYDQLLRSKENLVRPESLKDFNSLEPGTLIELSGTVQKNAIDAIIDYLDALRILVSLDNSSKQQVKKDIKNFQSMRDTLDEDRKRTPISTVLLNCKKPKGLSAAITLRTENLRDLTLSELNKNDVKVVGKITRVINEGESMSAFENYGFSMVNTDVLNEIFDDLKNNKEVNVDISEITVSGPAVQVLPLMIFV